LLTFSFFLLFLFSSSSPCHGCAARFLVMVPHYFFLQSLPYLVAVRKFSVFIALPILPHLLICYSGFRQAFHRGFFLEFVFCKQYLTPPYRRYMIVINGCCRLTSASNMSHILVRRDSKLLGGFVAGSSSEIPNLHVCQHHRFKVSKMQSFFRNSRWYT
jgi:hypothetical protein